MRSLFIGLGEMGGRMAKRLAEKVNLTVYDGSATRTQGFRNRLLDLNHLHFDTVMTMLPNDAAMESLFLGPKGILGRMPTRSMIIDFSTTSYRCSKSISKVAAKNGIKFIDSPVSGGVIGAEKGKLILLMGCTEEEVLEQMEMLSLVSEQRYYFGERGKGIVAKLCNNFILMNSMAATCEAIEIAARLGIDREHLVSVFDKCSGQSWVTSKYSPVPTKDGTLPASHDYEGGFKTKLALKDLLLMKALLDEVDGCSKLIQPLEGLYGALVQEGYGEKDFGVYLKALKSGSC